MVAAKDNSISVDADPRRETDHELSEVVRGHSRVAAELIDLIAGCFNQDRHGIVSIGAENSPKDIRMSRAIRRYRAPSRTPIFGNDIPQVP